MFLRREHFLQLFDDRIREPVKAALNLGGTASPFNILCPQCKRPFRQYSVEYSLEIHPIDYCEVCDALWLDGSEADSFPRSRKGSQTMTPAGAMILAQWKGQKLDEDLEEFQVRKAYSVREYILGFLGFPIEFETLKLHRPIATWAIAFACTVTTVWYWISSLTSLDLGFIPSAPFRMFGLSILTSFAVHANFFHLIGNMYALIVFGDNIEDDLGISRFLTLLMGSAVFSIFCDFLLRYGSAIPSIGASGGISGIVAYYCFRFRSHRLGWAHPMTLIHRGTYWAIRAPYFGLIWLGYQFMGLFVNTNVNYAAHISGALFGSAIYWRDQRK